MTTLSVVIPARRVIVSNQLDFFSDFEQTHGAGLPREGVSYGNEWDLYCAALAEVSARVKRAVEKLRAAEALATLVSLRQPTFLDGRQADRDQAWMNLGLFWEHNFGMTNPQTGGAGVSARIAWQRRLADEVDSYVNNIHDDARDALAAMIPSGSAARYLVFNPLGWARSDVADLPYASGPAAVHVIDLLSGAEAPSQIVGSGTGRAIRILASDIPAVGYKVFELRPGAGGTFPPVASVNGGVLSHPAYTLTLAESGAITSLIDHQRGDREFVRMIDGRAMNDLGPSAGSLRAEEVGPVSATLVAEASGPLKRTTRVTVFHGSRRIAIHNTITENFDATATWSFGFNLDGPDIWHEEVGAVIRAKLATEGGHYASRCARYDWLTLNHFADVSAGGVGVTLSNADCYFMRLGASTPTSLDIATPQINVLAGGRVGGDGTTGLPSQGGDSHFVQRFALITHDGYSQAEAMRFALEHQNPLVAAPITGGAGYPEQTYSFLNSSEPNILIWAIKPHEDGISQGVVARLWNMGDVSYTSLTLPGREITSAQWISHIETPTGAAIVKEGALIADLATQQIRSFLITSGVKEPPATPSPVATTTTTETPIPSPGSDCHSYLPLIRR